MFSPNHNALNDTALHCMFDIDGTLVQSYELDSECYIEAVHDVLGVVIEANWEQYRHVTDAGITNELLSHYSANDQSKYYQAIKIRFLKHLRRRIERQAVQEIAGAKAFISMLSSLGVTLSFATGAWRESAMAKLNSAGVVVSSHMLFSCDDHFSRQVIMKMAHQSATAHQTVPCIYFGDGVWDKQAANELGYGFCLVGNRLEHTLQINDFLDGNAVIEILITFLAASDL